MIFVIAALLLMVARPGAAQPAQPNPPPFADRLTRDWGGVRSTLADKGISFDLELTQFYQGLISGTRDDIDGDDDFNYGGRTDVYLTLDTGKLGWWKGGIIRAHAENFFGPLSANLGGALLPTGLGVRLPNGGGDLEVTNITLTQQLGQRATLIAGKINTVDLLASHPFFGGGGHSRMFDLAFAAPPTGLQPAAITGAILSLAGNPVTWTVMVFDPNDRTLDYWMDDAFEDGVNMSVSARFRGRLADRTSNFTLTGIYSTKDSVDLNDVLLPPDLQSGEKSGSWHISVQFDHFLHEISDQPGTGWGVFVKAGASDGNPNPYQGFITGGIGGKGLFASRPSDTFGVGYFHYNFSDVLQSVIDPFVSFKDEQGVEAFYNLFATGWLHVAGDLQIVRPGLGTTDTAFTGGVRMKVRF